MDQKRPPTPEHAARIARAVQALTDAKVERDAAMVDALKAGASVREVAIVSGMSPTQVQKIGHANGWPTPEQQIAREVERVRRQQWTEAIEQFRVEREDRQHDAPEADDP